MNCCIDSDLDKLSTVKFPGIRQVCVCVCFQVDCGTCALVTSFNLANLHLEEMWATHIYTQKSCLHVNIFVMSNLEISRFCMSNLEISIFCMSNLEILIFCMSNLEISIFCMQRDLLTRTEEQEIGAVSRRLPDNPGS